MKQIITAIFILLFFNACNQENGPKESNKNSLKGVWEMVRVYYYENGKLTDTIEVPEYGKHMKIFHTTKYMWSNQPKSKDSLEWFAYGNYSKKGDTLFEHKEYASKAMKGHSNTSKWLLTIEKNRYTQIGLDNKGDLYYGEVYKRIE